MPVKFQLDGDASRLIKEAEKGVAAQDKLEKSIKDTASAADKAAKGMADDAAKIASAYERSFGVIAASGRKVGGGHKGSRGASPHIEMISHDAKLAIKDMEARKAAETKAIKDAGVLSDITRKGELAKFAKKMEGIKLRDAAYTRGARVAGVDIANPDAVAAFRLDKAKRIKEDRAFSSFLGDRRSAFAADMAGPLGSSRDHLSALSLSASDEIADMDRRTASKDMEAEHARDRFGDRMRRERERKEKANSNSIRRAAGLGAAALAVRQGYAMAGAAGERYSAVGAANVDLEDKLTGLVNIGDNVKNPGKVREMVLANAIGRGFDRDDVINARYNFESSASNLDKNTQNEIWNQGALLTKVKGGSLDTNIQALTKAVQNFGGERSVKEIANLMAFTEEQGSVNMQQLADSAPDALPAFKEAGYQIEDFAAAVSVATPSMGSADAAITQMRNFPSRMLKLSEELGVTLKGTFGERVAQLNAALPKDVDARALAIKKGLGDEGMVLGSVLFGKVDELTKQIALANQGRGNYLSDKRVDRLSDNQYASSETTKQIAALNASIGTDAAKDPAVLAAQEAWDATLTGTKLANSNKPWMTEEMIRAAAVNEITVGGKSNRMAGLTYSKLYDNSLIAAGGAQNRQDRDDALIGAYQMKLSKGAALGFKDADGSYTNEEDAGELLSLRKKGIYATPEMLVRMHELGGGSNAEAMKWLTDASEKMLKAAEIQQEASKGQKDRNANTE